MTFDNLMAISGLGGLHIMIGNKNNGLIVREVGTDKKRFVSSRKHQFTPLASIGIYTDDGDTLELKKVFRNMLDQMEDNPPPPTSSTAAELTEYFEDVLPNYDKDRVRNADIKKAVKWFMVLKENDLLSTLTDEIITSTNDDSEEKA